LVIRPVLRFQEPINIQEIRGDHPVTCQRLEHLRELIDECARNNGASQKIVYERYYGYALKIVFRYIYRYEKAVDTVNDGFVKLFRNMYRFNHDQVVEVEQLFLGWMKRIMINVSIDQLRKNHMVAEIGGIPEHVWDVADKAQTPEQSLMYKELVAMIKQLPPAYRSVFNMIVIDGMTHHEVADMLGISIGTSKSNLSRARVLLQKNIKDLEASDAVYR
jgi:RNA polymerase sigma factor (sigma-70 family)